MDEKSLIFILSTNREKYFKFLQDISYYTYEKTIGALAEFAFDKFQLNHYWEKDYILDLLYDKLEVSHYCYVSDSNFCCIFGEFLTCDNATDVYCSECDVLKSRAVIYNQRHDGSLQIVAYYKINYYVSLTRIRKTMRMTILLKRPSASKIILI